MAPVKTTVENITFAGAIFVAVLVIITFFPSNKGIELFASWDHIAPLQVIKMGSCNFIYFLFARLCGGDDLR